MPEFWNQFDPLDQGDAIPSMSPTLANAMGVDPEMERLRKREDEIYARIMKGPRQRQKEIYDELWQRRGAGPKAGKLATLFANLGEMGRAIGGGKEYKSVDEQAREQALKEYQTEIGPLQREASVLSSAQKALTAQNDLRDYRNKTAAVMEYSAKVRGAKTQAETERINAMYPTEIRLMAARTGLVNEQTALAEQKTLEAGLRNEALASTGGWNLTGEQANAAGMAYMLDQNRKQGGDTLKVRALLEAMKRSGKTPGQTGPLNVQRIPTFRPQTWVDNDGVSHTLNIPTETIRTYRDSTGGGQQPGPMDLVNQFLGEPQTVQHIETPEGQVYQSKPAPKRFDIATGTYTRQGGTPEPTKDFISRATGIPREAFKNFNSSRWADSIGPVVGKKSPESVAKETYNANLTNMVDSALDSYLGGKTDFSGLFNNWKTSLSSAFGTVDPKALAVRMDDIQSIAAYLYSVSGKAISDKEREFLLKGLPNVGMDNARTFLLKSIRLKALLDLRTMQTELRLTPEEYDKVLQTQSGQKILKSYDDIIQAAEDVQKVKRGGNQVVDPKTGKPGFKIGNSIFTNPNDLKVVESGLKSAARRTSKQKLFNRAILEADINDVIPNEAAK